MSKRTSTSSCVRRGLLTQNYSLPTGFSKRTELLLPYKSYVKKLSKERNIKQLNIKVNERYKFRNKTLTIEISNTDKDIDDVRAITKYDSEFFKIVNGRPLFHCIPLYKSISSILNKRLRMKQEIGYQKDNALSIDINFRIEKNIYAKTLQRVSEQAKAFDKFVMEDYEKSMRVLDREEILNFKLHVKIAELQRLAEEGFIIMSRLLGLDYKYGLQQKYGRFLYYLSPPMWRSNNREFARSVEIEAKGFDYGTSNDEDTFTALFQKMRNECCASPIKPVLYFVHPQDLVNVFNGMEKQLLYHFSRETQLVPHKKSMKDAIRMLRQKIDHDTAVVTASIKGFEKLLSFCEERSFQFKDQFFRILHGFFYEAVGTADVLKLIFHLEFCYSKVFYEKPINLDMVTIAKAIESMYMDYSKKLDAIQSDSVRRAMRRCIDLNNQKIDKAKKASKELRLAHRLEKELLRSHNMVPERDQLFNVHSNYDPGQKIKHDLPKYHRNKRSYQLTDAEIEYLTLFTDWNKNEDPALYLQSFSIDKDKNNKSDKVFK